MAERIRIGVLLDGEFVPQWVANLLARLGERDQIEIAFVLVGDGAWSDKLGVGRSAVARAWCAVERGLFRIDDPDAATALVPAALERLRLPSGIDASAAPLAMLRNLRQREVDVLLQLGATPWGVPLCGVARLGLWRLRADEWDPSNSGPDRASTARVGVLRLEMLEPHATAGRDAATVIAEAAIASDATSILRSHCVIAASATVLVLREFTQLAHEGVEDWRERSSSVASVVAPSRFARRAGSAGAAAAGLQRMGRAARSLTRGLRVERWSLSYMLGSPLDADTRLQNLHRLEMPQGHSWRRPTLAVRQGRRFVFFEARPGFTAHSAIACLEIRADGGSTEARTVLQGTSSVCAPHVFEHSGDWFLLCANLEGQLSLYRAATFPFEWTLLQALRLPVALTDAVVHFDGARCWLLASELKPGAGLAPAGDALRVYGATDFIAGPWREHVRAPALLGVGARNGGRPWLADGVLYRVAAERLGDTRMCVSVRAVTGLGEDRYSEQLVRRFDPDDLRGVHALGSLEFAQGLTIVGSCTRRLR